MRERLDRLFGRELRYRYRKLIKPTKVSLHGIAVDLKQADLPYSIWKALAQETYEAPEVEAIVAFCRPGMRVVELGAGLGVTSLVLASIVGAENLFCFEANPFAVRAARRNFRTNKQAIFLRNRIAVGAADGTTVDFFVHKDPLCSSRIDRGQTRRAIRVPTFGLEPFAAEHGIHTLVMDIEGGEADLLLECGPLETIKLIIMEEHPALVGAERLAAMHARLAELGFRPAQPPNGKSVSVYQR